MIVTLEPIPAAWLQLEFRDSFTKRNEEYKGPQKGIFTIGTFLPNSVSPR